MSATTVPVRSALVPRALPLLEVRPEAEEMVTLVVDTSTAPMRFAPGQFNMVYAHGVGESAISISSSPSEPDRIAHTLHAVGSVTNALARLRPGDTVGLRGPFGRAWPEVSVDGDLVVVAGGIGLAPVRSAVLAALELPGRTGRTAVVAGARTPTFQPFVADLEAWAEDPRVTVHRTVDRAADGWDGNVGFVTELLDDVEVDPARTTVLTCGPEAMMRIVAGRMIARGVPPTSMLVTLERNMRCAVATCGHCQLGTELLCRDGAVYAWPEVERLLAVGEL